MKNNIIDCISIYLGKECNLRCGWCYDQANTFDSLDIKLFENFYEDVINENIRDVVLLGGEPLVYPKIDRIFNICKNQNIHIASNGLGLSNKKTLSLIQNHGKVLLYLSIKGFDRHSFMSSTKIDGFNKLNLALKELLDSKIPVDYSYVYNDCLSKDECFEFINFCNVNNIKVITICEPRPFLDNNRNVIKSDCTHIQFQEFVNCLVTNGMNVYVKIQFPFCDYSPTFIAKLMAENRLISSCSVKSGGSLIFNSNLELILCHSNYDVCLGRYKKDFKNYSELISYFFSDSIRRVYNRFGGCPQKKCLGCNYWQECGGGCVMNWR